MHTFIVAVHQYWPNGTHTTGPIEHVGPFGSEAEARAWAEKLERPLVGYVSSLRPPA